MNIERAIELSPQSSALIIVDIQAEGCERMVLHSNPSSATSELCWTDFVRPTERLSMFSQCERKTIPIYLLWQEYSLIEEADGGIRRRA